MPARSDSRPDSDGALTDVPGIRVGLSPRAGISLLAAAKAHAFIAGRGFVTANDVQAVFIEASAHRIHVDIEGKNRELAMQLLKTVAVD